MNDSARLRVAELPENETNDCLTFKAHPLLPSVRADPLAELPSGAELLSAPASRCRKIVLDGGS